MKNELLMKRSGIYLLVLTIVVMLMAGFSVQVQAEEPRYGGILKQFSSQVPRAIGWPSSDAGPRLPDYFLLFEPLLRIDDNGMPAPFLATSYKYGPDLKTLTFTIRKGVKFHDGADLNAEVVKMNIEERKKGILGGNLRAIESIDVIDEYTVRLNLSEYKNSLLEEFAAFNGLMVSPKVIEKVKKEKKGKKWAKKNPVGTGAFKFVKFERNVMLKVEKFDGYWQKGKPYLDGVETLYIADNMTALTAMRAGEAHIWWQVQIKDALELEKHGFEIINYSGSMRAFAWDAVSPDSVLKDKRVREAVEYAIDRPAIAQTLGYGHWEPLSQYARKISNGYIPDFGRSYNPEKAKQLLKEAGYPNGLKIKIMTVNQPEGRDTMSIIQQYLMKAGIETKLEFFDMGKFFQAGQKGYRNGLQEYSQTLPVNLTKQLSDMFKKDAARFPLILRPSKLQEINYKAVRTPDYETQTELTKKAVRIITEEAAALPLWSLPVINVKHKSLRDVNYSHTWRFQWTPENAWLSE